MVAAQPGIPQAALSAIERAVLLNATRHGGKAEAGAITGKVLGEFPNLRGNAAAIGSEIKRVVGYVNEMTAAEQLKLLEAKYPDSTVATPKPVESHQLAPLPGAVKGQTVLRLPPEPSGFMTIGHAMAFSINYIYKQTYDGVLWLRFEDTNPRKVETRYYDSFREGIGWLGIEVDHEKSISEDNPLMYSTGLGLIESGKAYACSCDFEKVKRLRFAGTPCEHRDRPSEESVAIWNEMLARRHGEGSVVIRFKGDMQSLDYSLRDPSVFRIIEKTHPLTGDKYVVWPTYDLANTVEDQLCGVTHVLRSSEFNATFQEVLREALGFRKLAVLQFSRFNFKGTPVQKRLLRPLVEQGLVAGWDDPRMPTVAGVRRRGIVPEAIRRFTLQVGYTKAEHEYEWSLLFAVNRKVLDPVSKRVFFVPDPVKLKVTGAPRREVSIRFHPDAELGSRTIRVDGEFWVARADLDAMAEGTVFRLMDLCNLRLTGKGEAPTAAYEGDELTQETRKVQWVSEGHVGVKVLVPGELFDAAGEFNKDSLATVTGIAEAAFSSFELGDIVQFPRFGFCRLDSPGTCILAHR